MPAQLSILFSASSELFVTFCNAGPLFSTPCELFTQGNYPLTTSSPIDTIRLPVEQGEVFVYLVYLDDSCHDSKHQVIAGVLIHDSKFQFLEGYLRFLVSKYVPEDMRDDFEFHARDIYHGKPPFDKLGHEMCMQILESAARGIGDEQIPVVYGAVHAGKLRASIHATATPADVAFRLCIPEIEDWFRKNAKDDLGIIICDDTTNHNTKKNFLAAFRAQRCKVKSELTHSEDGKLLSLTESRGKLEHIHDEMYFGNSADSTGIQLADICCFLILRHLDGHEDTEYLFKRIEPCIFSAKVDAS